MSAVAVTLLKETSKRRLQVLLRLSTSSNQPHYRLFSDEKSPKSISIGDVTKALKSPTAPELVPVKYLPKDAEIPPETLKVITLLSSVPCRYANQCLSASFHRV